MASSIHTSIYSNILRGLSLILTPNSCFILTNRRLIQIVLPETRKKVANSVQSDMASDQVSRRENTTTERDIYIQKDRVPKMTTHFESLAEKERGSDAAGGKETPHEGTGNTLAHEERTTGPYAIGKFDVSAAEERGGSIESTGRNESHKEKGGCTEMAGKEETIDEEKDKRESVDREEGGEKPEQLSLEEISKLRASAQQTATETIRAAEARYNKAKESASQGD